MLSGQWELADKFSQVDVLGFDARVRVCPNDKQRIDDAIDPLIAYSNSLRVSKDRRNVDRKPDRRALTVRSCSACQATRSASLPPPAIRGRLCRSLGSQIRIQSAGNRASLGPSAHEVPRLRPRPGSSVPLGLRRGRPRVRRCFHGCSKGRDPHRRVPRPDQFVSTGRRRATRRRPTVGSLAMSRQVGFEIGTDSREYLRRYPFVSVVAPRHLL